MISMSHYGFVKEFSDFDSVNIEALQESLDPHGWEQFLFGDIQTKSSHQTKMDQTKSPHPSKASSSKNKPRVKSMAHSRKKLKAKSASEVPSPHLSPIAEEPSVENLVPLTSASEKIC